MTQSDGTPPPRSKTVAGTRSFLQKCEVSTIYDATLQRARTAPATLLAGATHAHIENCMETPSNDVASRVGDCAMFLLAGHLLSQGYNPLTSLLAVSLGSTVVGSSAVHPVLVK